MRIFNNPIDVGEKLTIDAEVSDLRQRLNTALRLFININASNNPQKHEENELQDAIRDISTALGYDVSVFKKIKK